jgi:hypothetical protein
MSIKAAQQVSNESFRAAVCIVGAGIAGITLTCEDPAHTDVYRWPSVVSPSLASPIRTGYRAYTWIGGCATRTSKAPAEASCWCAMWCSPRPVAGWSSTRSGCASASGVRRRWVDITLARRVLRRLHSKAWSMATAPCSNCRIYPWSAPRYSHQRSCQSHIDHRGLGSAAGGASALAVAACYGLGACLDR